MAYAPFKMKGHTLPGIKQKSPAKHSAYGQPHPTNPQGKEQPVGAGHPATAKAHNVKAKKSPTKWVQAVAALAPIAMDMMKKKK